jgi:hypothetical protein
MKAPLRLWMVLGFALPLASLANAESVQSEADEYTRYELLLPPGWYCTFSAAPATVSQLPDGTVRLDYWNDRPEPVDVLLKAKRRVAAAATSSEPR